MIDMNELGPSITDSRGIIKQQEALGVMTCVLIFEVFQEYLHSPEKTIFSVSLPYKMQVSLKVEEYLTLGKVLTTFILRLQSVIYASKDTSSSLNRFH